MPLGNDSRFNPAPAVAGKVPYDNGSGYSAATAGTTSQVLVGGAAPAFGNVPSAALTSVPAANLTGTVPIGTIPTGTSSSTVTIGNDSRLPPAPSGAGKIVYDTGSAYSALAAGTTSQVLVGGSAPSFGAVPAAAITALTGTVSGTVTLSGAVTLNSATLGGNLAAGGNKVTGLGAPTAASSDAATATYAEAQKTGGGGPAFYLNTAQSWTANAYLGIGGDGSSTVNVNVVPWVVPAAGTLKNLRVQGLANAGTNLNVTIYKASSAASPSYASTALVASVSSSAAAGSDATHSVSVSAGDLIVAVCSAFWPANGLCATCQYIPT